MRILVIEDDLALSAGLCFELYSNGYLTVAAYNCRKARQLLQEDPFDLVIMDVNLPDGNGFDLYWEVKAIKPELPVMFLTANDLEQDVLNGFGCRGLYYKAVQYADFFAAGIGRHPERK